jgi:hypothetical protein
MRFTDITIRVPKNLLEKVSQMVASHGQTVDSFTTMAWMECLLETADPHPRRIEHNSNNTLLPGKALENVSKDGIDIGSLQAAGDDEFTYQGHLWGQFHRHLPVKFTLRHLALLLQQADGPYVPTSEWYASVRATANDAWKALRAMDRQFMKSRGEQLASGFPKPTDKDGKVDKERIQKGLSRFIRHFCVDGKDSQHPAGMPAELGFIAVREDKRGQMEVGLTQKGLDFVLLENPIFDVEPWGDALHQAEVTFLINHTKTSLPKDLRLMINLLEWVHNEGATGASDLDKKMEINYGETTPWGYNAATCSTYKGGAMGRLSEMKLLKRRWENRMAVYSVSETGIAFLEEMEMKK